MLRDLKYFVFQFMKALLVPLIGLFFWVGIPALVLFGIVKFIKMAWGA